MIENAVQNRPVFKAINKKDPVWVSRLWKNGQMEMKSIARIIDSVAKTYFLDVPGQSNGIKKEIWSFENDFSSHLLC